MRDAVRGLAMLLVFQGTIACTSVDAGDLVANGDFERWQAATPDAAGKVDGWILGDPPRTPRRWTLNKAYPGQLLLGAEDPAAGAAYATLRRTGDRGVHLYQRLTGLKQSRWYRFQARVRGGAVRVVMYEYRDGGPMSVVDVAQNDAPADTWREVAGYYRVPDSDWTRSALALVLDRTDRVDLDVASLRLVAAPSPPPDAADLVLENDAARLVLTPDGRWREFRAKSTDRDHLGAGPRPLATAVHRGERMRLSSLTRSGDRLSLRFPDPAVRIELELSHGPRHFRFEIVHAAPDDLESVELAVPWASLDTVGRAFNATYDDTFGLSFLTASVNARAALVTGVRGSLRATITAYRRHGIEGAAMALVAAPRDEFEEAIREAELACGLPSPRLGGEWARDSASVRKSYLFANPVAEADVDALIEHAKLGGFETILFLQFSWLANHGHFDINTETFPRGIDSVRDAVRKIHAAGLEAGAHLFGPSISPNDPYVTPVPDPRLATVDCPPLAEALEEDATTVTLAAPPPLPPNVWAKRNFPGRFLRIGDEIIAYDRHEDGPPFRYVGVERGALGTRRGRYPAGTEVDGLLALFKFFLVDPDSTLAEELAQRFATVFNACEFDFAYFDGSDGTGEPYLDTWYYMGKMHLELYRKLGRDVLYQTSLGVGRGVLWHIVPRAASADGRDDIKSYLDERLPKILRMEDDLTRADVGWYRWYRDVRPDQMEYVCAKVAGVDGSFSLETSLAALRRLPQSRQMLEMVGRWERCRKNRAFSNAARERLREPGREFKLFVAADGCRLHDAIHEPPRRVEALDGRHNVWRIRNDRSTAVPLGFEIVRPEDAKRADGSPRLEVNGRSVDFGVGLEPGAAIVHEGAGSVVLWPPGMQPSRTLSIPATPHELVPGENTLRLTWNPPERFPGDVEVRLYRLPQRVDRGARAP